MKKRSRTIFKQLIGIVLFLTVLPLTEAGAPVPKPEGTLRVAMFSLGEEGFLPDRCTGTTSSMWELVYDFLIYADSKTNKPIPGVAERWEYSKDARTLTFYLRKGIQFHDGWGELTAEDVKFTIQLNAGPKSTNLRSVDLRNIESMEIKDRYTLVLNLKKPDPMLWISFCTADSATLGILCKKYVETVGEDKANRTPIGSGPYRLVEHRIGDYAKFEAYDQHWLVVPEFKHVIEQIVPEVSTRIAMLKTGEIDIAIEVPLDKVAELEKAGLGTVLIPNAVTHVLAFGGMLLPQDKRYVAGTHRTDPWKDIKVREAMNIAIDRDALIKAIFQGKAQPAPIYWTLPGWDKLKPVPYDPKRAKQLLTEAGYPNGFSFKLYSHDHGGPEGPLLAQAAAGYWEAVGLKAEIVPMDYATWRDRNKSGKTTGCIWTHSMAVWPDYASRLLSYEYPNASTPVWQDDESKTLIDKIVAEYDMQKRDALYERLAQYYRSCYSHIPLMNVPRVHGVNQKVLGAWSPPRPLIRETWPLHGRPSR